LGGLLAEARRNIYHADLGLVRTESIAADLPAGPVTYASLARVEPTGAEIVALTVTGVQLRALLEQAVAGSDGPTAHIAGAQVRYDPKAKPGSRVRSVVFPGNRKLRAEAEYTVATDDSTAAGAGGYAMLVGRRREQRGLLDVEATAAFLRRLSQPVEIGIGPAFQSTRR
jgi:2',3'-cyclic-nucleotide 2'-phosphodiesterase (5'-nucleotidase family)